MHLEWNKVTWFSKLLAVGLFLSTLGIGFLLGTSYSSMITPAEVSQLGVQPITATTASPKTTLSVQRMKKLIVGAENLYVFDFSIEENPIAQIPITERIRAEDYQLVGEKVYFYSWQNERVEWIDFGG